MKAKDKCLRCAFLDRSPGIDKAFCTFPGLICGYNIGKPPVKPHKKATMGPSEGVSGIRG